jgi:hypothetical protein
MAKDQNKNFIKIKGVKCQNPLNSSLSLADSLLLPFSVSAPDSACTLFALQEKPTNHKHLIPAKQQNNEN